MSPGVAAPGPRGAEVIRTLIGRRDDPIAMQRHLRDAYGDVVHVRMGGLSQFLVSRPEAVRHVLVERPQNYTKGPGYELLSHFLGRGLVTSDGEHWRSHRRLVQPALGRDRLAAFVGVMAAAAEEEASALEAAGETVDVFERMTALALRIVTRTVLGSDLGDRENEVHEAVGLLFDQVERLSISRLRYLELLPGGGRLRWIPRMASTLPTPARRRFDRAVRTLDEVIYALVARRRREGGGSGGPTDLIGELLRASEEERVAFSDRDVRDEVVTMFIAGHETVATTLTWTLYLLALHPEHRERIASEATAALGKGRPSLDDLPRLTTARNVFQEASRLYPAIWRFSRWAVTADRISGFQVPAGSVISISPYLIHRDPVFWPDPDRFDPGRFHPDRHAGRPWGCYLPFGAGQRMCPGGAFATAEAQVILAILCRRFTFEVPSGHEPEFEPRIALRPRGGLTLRLLSAGDHSPRSFT